MKMTVEGSLERVLNSVLPHEITHTIFASKFRRPLPRWADEGGSVLSEDYQELYKHDILVREIINTGRMIPLSRLFVLPDYPNDVMCLYAQGFSVANYLVALEGRKVFLEFVATGQQKGWDHALAQHYGIRSVAALEKQWIGWIIAGKGTGADPPLFARDMRRPAQPNRVVRGQMPEEPQVASGWQASSANEPAVAVRHRSLRRLALAAKFGTESGRGTAIQRAAFEDDPFRRTTHPPVGPPRAARVDEVGRARPDGNRQADDRPDRTAVGSVGRPSHDDADDLKAQLASLPRRQTLIPIAISRSRRAHGDESTSAYQRSAGSAGGE